MTGVGTEKGELLFSGSHVSFLKQCLELKIEFNRPLHLKGHCAANAHVDKKPQILLKLKTFLPQSERA